MNPKKRWGELTGRIEDLSSDIQEIIDHLSNLQSDEHYNFNDLQTVKDDLENYTTELADMCRVLEFEDKWNTEKEQTIQGKKDAND